MIDFTKKRFICKKWLFSSMNNIIEKPTRTIVIHLEFINQERDNNKSKSQIDFYKLNVPETAIAFRNEDGQSKLNVKKHSNEIINTMASTSKCLEHLRPNEKGMALIDEFDYCAIYRMKPQVSDIKTFISNQDLDFIVLIIQNDIRIKDYRISDNLLVLKFNLLEDSISFYKQYLNIFQMKFDDKSVQTMNFLNINVSTIEKLLDFNCLNVDDCKVGCDLSLNKPDVPVKCYNIETNQNKMEFDSRVEYFNRMRSIFTKSDYKKIELCLESGNYDYIIENCKEISVGISTNVLMQALIKKLDDEGLCLLINSFGQDIVPISATKYGAYVIQILLIAVKTSKSQSIVSRYFKPWGQFLITHEIGNYTIQKLIRFESELIFEFFIDNFENIINNEFGFKIFKRCLPFFSDKKKKLREKVSELNIKLVYYTALKNILY